MLITARLLYIGSALAFGLATLTVVGGAVSNFYADITFGIMLALLGRAIETPK